LEIRDGGNMPVILDMTFDPLPSIENMQEKYLIKIASINYAYAKVVIF
jgi:hypothetical protein